MDHQAAKAIFNNSLRKKQPGDLPSRFVLSLGVSLNTGLAVLPPGKSQQTGIISHPESIVKSWRWLSWAWPHPLRALPSFLADPFCHEKKEAAPGTPKVPHKALQLPGAGMAFVWKQFVSPGKCLVVWMVTIALDKFLKKKSPSTWPREEGKGLEQWFSKGNSFENKKGTFGNIWRQVWLLQWERGCLWYLMGGGQGYCQTSCNLQDSPHHKKSSAQDVNSAEGERAQESWLRGSLLLNTGLPKGV